MKEIKKMIYSLVPVIITAAASGWFTQNGIKSWYPESVKAPFTPPNQVFQIIWPLLYATLILSFYIVLQSINKPAVQRAKRYFLTQLGLQILWTYVFFDKGYLGLGLVVILALDYVVAKMVKIFENIRPVSAYMLYPYFLWLVFATYLNFSFILNNSMIVN